MRTNIDIDDDLMAAAMRAVGLGTKKATVEEALRRLVEESEARRALDELRGLGWEGDLDAMRRADPAGGGRHWGDAADPGGRGRRPKVRLRRRAVGPKAA